MDGDYKKFKFLNHVKCSNVCLIDIRVTVKSNVIGGFLDIKTLT